MIRTLSALFGVISMMGAPISLIGFLIQFVRKRPNKTIWGIVTICFVVVFVVCMFLTPTESEEEPTPSPSPNVEVQEESSTETETDQAPSSAPTEEPVPSPTEEPTQAEKFAESNDISVELAESLESVLTGMELTDKSRVGVFHYDLSNVYEWRQIEDWANGERYSAYMDMEHVWYIYVTDNTVVGIRDGNGNTYY